MRLQHAIFVRFLRYNRAIVVDAIGDSWPAEVLSFDDSIEFVSAAWSVLGLPKIARSGMEGESLRIAMAIGPNALEGIRASANGLSSGMRPSSYNLCILPLAVVTSCASGRWPRSPTEK